MLTTKNSFFLFVLLFLQLAFSHCIASEEKQYLLQKVAQAPQLPTERSQWLQLFEQPGNSQYYYLANQQGQIYQLEQDRPSSTSLLLDLQQLPTNNAIIQLTAFTLHPNFSSRGQEGYATFYTAHIANASTSHGKRLLDPSINRSLKYDAVVTEWQLNEAKQIDFPSQREVLRIAIPTTAHGIKQLSFNPYSKSWHDSFGQLYIAVDESPSLMQYPLYSGAILRIHPQKVASGGYSVPQDNPYFSSEHIDNTLYLLGAGKIKQFIWPDKYSNKLLISHQYPLNNNPMHWLSYGNSGADWREFAPKDFIYQNKQALSSHSLLVYRGQNAPVLRNKLLFISKNKQQWRLNSLGGSNSSPEISINQKKKSLTKPLLEWSLSQKELNVPQLSLFRDNRGELLFFNEHSGAIYQLFQQNISLAQSSNATKDSSVGLVFFFTILVCLLASYILYQVNKYLTSAKTLVRREFSNLLLTEDKLAINLFKRHQHEAEKIIALADIKQFQLLLGDLVIATVNTTLGHGFNDEQEQALREIFHKEQVAKMVDNKVRRISLAINTGEKHSQVICLYLRKGSDRITKGSYFEIVDLAIDWCWLIAKQINKKNTGDRIIRARVTAADIAKSEHKSHDATPLHAQAAIIRPATHPELEDEAISTDTTEAVSQQKTANTLTKEKKHNSAHIETDLVNAIEKLVKLQQQGFLSAAEFAQAKTKLLASLHKTE